MSALGYLAVTSGTQPHSKACPRMSVEKHTLRLQGAPPDLSQAVLGQLCNVIIALKFRVVCVHCNDLQPYTSQDHASPCDKGAACQLGPEQGCVYGVLGKLQVLGKLHSSHCSVPISPSSTLLTHTLSSCSPWSIIPMTPMGLALRKAMGATGSCAAAQTWNLLCTITPLVNRDECASMRAMWHVSERGNLYACP